MVVISDKLSAPYFVPCCTEIVRVYVASLKRTTVFTVTTECISQNGSEKKFQLQPDIVIIAHSQTDQFFQKELKQFLFYLIWPRYHRPRRTLLIKLMRWNADGQNVHHQRVTQSVQAVHPCEPCRLTSLSCRLPSSVQKKLQPWGFCDRYSSVKTKRGKLSVEMTDQPFVTKWTICLQTRYSFLPVRRPPGSANTSLVQHSST